jgi:hypothetical protein
MKVVQMKPQFKELLHANAGLPQHTVPTRSHAGILLTFQLINSLFKELPVMLLESLHHHDIHVFDHPASIAI